MFFFIEQASAISVLFPFICGLYNYRSFDLKAKLVFIYVLICVLTEIVAFVLAKNNISTDLLYNVFTFFESSLLAYLYVLIFDSKSAKRAIVIFYAVFIVLFFLDFSFCYGYINQSNIIFTFEAGFFVTLSIAYFYKLIRNSTTRNLLEFWFPKINSAILIYFSMELLMAFFSHYIKKRGMSTFSSFYIIHWVINIAFNGQIGTAFWKFKKA